MATGDRVPDDHLLLRRFDPTNSNESTWDQALETYALTPAALEFNSVQPVRLGASVYDDALLGANGIGRQEVTQPRWTHVAGLTAAGVKAVGAEVFVPEEAPFPEAPGPIPPHDLAHCEIWRPEPLPNRKVLVRQLAKAFTSVPLAR